MLLEIDRLVVHYGAVQALKQVSLHAEQGEIVTLIGANGAGKTTLLRTLSGLVPVRSGDIRYEGNIGHVPEGRDVFPEFSVLENLLVGAHTVPAREVEARLEAAYAMFPVLRERRRQRAGTLSGGEQQMLAIARALMTRPSLLLLDEPSLGLAPLLVREIFRTIREINQRGVTVLLVEQNAHMALSIAGRGYVLETGRVAIEDTASRLLQNEDVKKAYLGG